jgi:NadR type nicotinamide-nucleotide adenylyltransferase
MASILPTAPADGPARNRLTRIVVTGSESTGKTTLAQSLALHYRAFWIPEFAREYAQKRSEALTADDVSPIAAGQIAQEDAFFEKANGLVILDTDLISTVVYAEHYYGTAPSWITAAARERLADLYLLCDIDVPWVADTVRDAQHERSQLHDAFVGRLNEFGATVYVVRGKSPAERLSRAIEHIESWRGTAQT